MPYREDEYCIDTYCFVCIFYFLMVSLLHMDRNLSKNVPEPDIFYMFVSTLLYNSSTSSVYLILQVYTFFYTLHKFCNNSAKFRFVEKEGPGNKIIISGGQGTIYLYFFLS